MPGDEFATAATLSPTPIACSALTACGLTLTAAPISPRAGAASKTSAFIPRVLDACAAASPASPPPSIAIPQLDDILPPETLKPSSVDRDPRCLHNSSPALLLLHQVRSKLLRRSRPRVGADFCKCLVDFVAGKRTRHRFAHLLP